MTGGVGGVDVGPGLEAMAAWADDTPSLNKTGPASNGQRFHNLPPNHQ